MNHKTVTGYNITLDQALKQGGFYGPTGLWNSLVKIDGLVLRARVETLVIKKDLQQVYMHITNFAKKKYRIPGGSCEKDVPNYIQAMNECNEEARIKVKPSLINTGVHYIKRYKKPYKYDGIRKELSWVGLYTEVYVGEYDGPFTGKVDDRDKDDAMYKYGKFYPISEVYDILSDKHKEVIDDIFPVIKRSEIKEGTDMIYSDDNKSVHYYPYYTPREMAELGVHNESKNKYSDIQDDAIEWYHEYTDTLYNPDSENWLKELQERYDEYMLNPTRETQQLVLNLGWNLFVVPTLENVLMASKRTKEKLRLERERNNDVIITEEMIFTKKDIVLNIDDFDSGKSNILFITGLSGSGKTTMSSELCEQYSATKLSLDYFQNYHSIQNDPRFAKIKASRKNDPMLIWIDKYMKLNPEIKKQSHMFSNIDLVSFKDYFIPFFKWLISELKKDDDRYIVEGLHIVLYIPYKDIKKYPLICINTSATKSLVRHWQRDDWTIKDIVQNGYDDILQFKRWNDMYTDFKKSIDESVIIEAAHPYEFGKSQNLYFISELSMNDELLVPRVPNNYMTENSFEDNVTPRVCFFATIDGALMALSQNIKGKKFYVHVPEDGQRLSIIKPAVASVPDQLITHEHWVMEKVNLRCIGQIEITGDGDNEYEYTYKKYKYNKTYTTEIPGAKEYKEKLYDWKWRWIWKDDTNLTQENTLLLEGFLKSDKDIYYNKDKFDSGEINLCFITGHSGSGKSTMARSMQSAKVEHYELDDLNQNYKFTDDNLKEYGDLIYSFFKGPGKKYRYHSYDDMQNCTNPLDDSGDEFDKCVNRDFVKYAMKYANSHKNTKFVIEGIWLYFFFKPEELKDYAVYIKGTSRVLSAFRAAKRDSKDADTKTKRFMYSIKGTLSTLINKYSIEGERLINKYRDYYGKLEKVNESYIEEGLNLLKKLDEEKVSKEILDTIKPIILTSQNKSKASKLGLDLKCEITEVDGGMVFILVLEGPQEKRDTEETRSLLKDLASKCKSELSDIVSKVDIGDGDEGCLFCTIDKGKIRRKRKDLLESYIEESSHKSDFSYSGINTSTEKSEFKRNFREVFKEDPTESSINYMQMIKYKGDLVGYIGFSRFKEGKKKYLGIGNFMILKRYQRSGMGSKVISDIIDRYKDNYDEIYCYVDKDNTNAIAFYKKIAKVNTDNLTRYGYYVTLYKKGSTNESVSILPQDMIKESMDSLLYEYMYTNNNPDIIIQESGHMLTWRIMPILLKAALRGVDQYDYKYLREKKLPAILKKCKTMDDIKYMRRDAITAKTQMEILKRNVHAVNTNDENIMKRLNKSFVKKVKDGKITEKEIDTHIRWLGTEYKKLIDARAKEIRDSVKEFYIEESSNNKVYHLSQTNLDDKTIQPTVPSNYMTKNGYEDGKTKRVCFATSIDGCLRGLSLKCEGMKLFVHVPDGNYNIYKPSNKEVPDASITGEVWIKKAVKMKCIGQIYVIGDKGEDGIPYKYGDKTAELYDWEWKWIDQYIQEQESYIEEGYFKSTDNLEFNLDKWSKLGPHNLLYITGISGSGKTTLAKEICKKYKAEYIELDKFTLGIVKGLDRWFENVNNGTYEVHPLLKEYFSQLDHITTNGSWSKPDMGDEHTKFLTWFISKTKGNGTLYVVEGAQFFMKLSNMDPDLIKGEPLIIVGTSAFKSWVRRIKRDTSNDETISRFIYHLKKDVPMLFKYYFSNERDLQKYIKNIQSNINESVLSITEKAKYSTPYTSEEIKRAYGIKIYKELIKDPAHKYRMDTGIELIHKEPTKEELERIWKNWNLMSNDQKMKSDKKSMELFGKTNQDHYNELINSYTVDESSLLEMKRSELDDSEFGLPKLRKYPMPDKDHVLSAIRFFNYVSPENEKELARNIKKKMKQYNISPDRVGDKNRLKKYLTEDMDIVMDLLESLQFTNFEHTKPVLVFDLGSVLVDNKISFKETLYKSKLIPDDIVEELDAYIGDTYWNNKDKLEYYSEDEFYKYMIDRAPEYLKIYVPAALKLQDSDLRLLDYSKTLIKKLKEKGYKLYYISNWSKWSKDKLTRSGFFDFLKDFDGGIFSGDVGHMKPDNAIFQYFFNKYKEITPTECIFFDDRHDNISAAMNIGMYGILFNKLYTVEWIYDNLINGNEE